MDAIRQVFSRETQSAAESSYDTWSHKTPPPIPHRQSQSQQPSSSIDGTPHGEMTNAQNVQQYNNSSEAFPLMEISRMKQKARQLRATRQSSSSNRNALRLDDDFGSGPFAGNSVRGDSSRRSNDPNTIDDDDDDDDVINPNDSNSSMYSERDMALAMRQARLQQQQQRQRRHEWEEDLESRNSQSIDRHSNPSYNAGNSRNNHNHFVEEEHSSLGDVLGSVQTPVSRDSIGTSAAARQAQEQLLRGFHRSSPRVYKSQTPDTQASTPSRLSPNAMPEAAAEQRDYQDNNNNNNNNPFSSYWASPPAKDQNRQSPDPSKSSVTSTTSAASTAHNNNMIHDHDDNNNNYPEEDAPHCALHNLCGEAQHVDDIAWRNAIYLLGTQPHLARSIDEQGWTPLHVCVLGTHPPPVYMVRALLYVHPQACAQTDQGNRTALHLLAASSADLELLAQLAAAGPAAAAQRDDRGWTPLQLLCKNIGVPLTLDRVRALVEVVATQNDERRILDHGNHHQRTPRMRRGEHLQLTLPEIQAWGNRGASRHHAYPATKFRDRAVGAASEQEWERYPPDVQLSLRKLATWKKESNHNNNMEEDPVVVPIPNPVTIPAAETHELPLHMVLHRHFLEANTADVAAADDTERDIDNDTNNNNRALEDQEVPSMDSADDDDEDDVEMGMMGSASPQQQRKSSIPDFMGVVRYLVAAAGPESLSWRDADGLTPLWLTLRNGKRPGDDNDEDGANAAAGIRPSLELVQLLLGQTTTASIPAWAQDIAWHEIRSAASHHPATIMLDGQLPLHHVAQEWPYYGLEYVRVVRDAYPAAVVVPDAYGNTPLHLVLRHVSGIPAPPELVQLLYDDRVVHVGNQHRQTPLDLLLQSSTKLPTRLPRAWQASDGEINAYQRLLCTSVDQWGNNNNNGNDRNLGNAKDYSRLVQDLRKLPVWLREMACASPRVQDAILRKLARPVRFAMILLDGLLLVVLVTVFRIQLQDFARSQSSTEVSLKLWSTLVVYGCACGRLLMQAVLGVLAAQVGQLYHVALGNPFYWLDVAAMVLAVLTSVFFFGGNLTSTRLLQMGTVTTGLLWLSLFGYVSNWCQGMAIFIGVLKKIVHQVVWPLIAIAALCVGAAQMFYTLLQGDCSGSMVAPVCGVRDSFRVVYLLILGEPMVDIQGQMNMSNSAIVLVVLFFLFLVTCLLSLLATIIATASHIDLETVSVTAYWQPKLAFLLSTEEIGCWTCRMEAIESMFEKWNSWAERSWDLLVNGVADPKATNDKYWEFVKRREPSCCQSMARSVVAVFVIPIWLVAGVMSLGVFWPPQVRKCLLQTRRRAAKSKRIEDDKHVLDLQGQVSQLKTMSYARTGDLAGDVQELKQLLYMAMKEE